LRLSLRTFFLVDHLIIFLSLDLAMYGSHIPQGSPQGHGGAPLPPGWTAQYVAEEQRYIFINQRTGERSLTHPSPPSNYGGPAPRGYPPSSAGPGGAPQKNHNMLYGGVGLAAGLAGGAFVMHEHDKRKWFRGFLIVLHFAAYLRS
jgi:hypothetical protein